MEDAELRNLVTQLRKEDKSLNEILDVLHKEHDVRITFLDLRMLVAEIEKSKPVKTEKRLKEKRKREKTEEGPAAAGTRVEVDQIVQPGTQLSGTVEFQSGARAKWFVDAIGRLSLALEPSSAQPTQRDMVEFQQVLSRKLQGGA